MESPKKALARCEEILKSCNVEISAGDFSAMILIIDEILNYLEEEKIGGRAYLAEKLRSVRFSINAMNGSGLDNGRSYNQHFQWAYGDIHVAQRNLKDPE